MTALKSLDRAEKVIDEMPIGFWIDVRTLAKEAGLTVHAMSRFLIRAKKAGQVEYKRVPIRTQKFSLWKRLT